MNPAELFDRAGRALFGDQYVAPMAHLLGNDKSTVRNWAAGKSRIPPGVWREIAAALQDRAQELPALRAAVLDAASPEPSPTAPRPPTVKSRNFKDALITLSRPVTHEDSIALTRNLDAFTARHGLPKAIVGSGVSAMIIAFRPPLTDDHRAAFEQWFTAECDRIDREG